MLTISSKNIATAARLHINIWYPQCVLVHVKCNASGLLSWLVPSMCNPTELQIVQLSALMYCLIRMLICCYAIPELANMSAVLAVLS